MPLITVNGIRLNSVESGSGFEPIVFMHSHAGSLHDGSETISHLPKKLCAIALDQPGTGARGRPESGHSIEQVVDDLHGFAQALVLRRFHLVGHSMGGAIVSWFASEHPQLLLHLVLVAPAPAEGIQPLPCEMQRALETTRKEPATRRQLATFSFTRPLRE